MNKSGFLLRALLPLFLISCTDAPPTVEVDAAVGVVTVFDQDDDGIFDQIDICPNDPDPDQTDTDGDGQGDACDFDDDNDGVIDEADGCPLLPDPLRLDADGDGIGDECDDDDDGDGVPDIEDLCPTDGRYARGDADGDGIGDGCDEDSDGDDVLNPFDNCPAANNPDQSDIDGDGLGDPCDDDRDGDRVPNEEDNCSLQPNAPQDDMDEDGVGDVCDFDRDGDGVENIIDICPDTRDSLQRDVDGDGLGDFCDPCPQDPDNDIDDDGPCARDDNCPGVPNRDQRDSDGDSLGDACDPCPDDDWNDIDGDNVCGRIDNCLLDVNPDQSNLDGDALGDICDPCPADPFDDEDGDGVCGDVDVCPDTLDPEQLDRDEDGLGDRCDPFPTDPENDIDDDGRAAADDNCPTVANPDQEDRDGDGTGDACDGCIRGSDEDLDQDGVCGDDDLCPRIPNPDQLDSDGDGKGDVCDRCPNDEDDDIDGDGVCGDTDLCPDFPNPAQLDADEDGIGDRCDTDRDGDGIDNELDNCVDDPNPDQLDTYGTPRGDVCERLYFYEGFEEGLEDWGLSGNWVTNEQSAALGDMGLSAEIANFRQVVAISSPQIDLSESSRPRLLFWARQNLGNRGFFADIYVSQELRAVYSIAGANGNAGAIESRDDGFQLYSLDLRSFGGESDVRIRFRVTGSGDLRGALYIDEVAIDEEPRLDTITIPWEEPFDTLEMWEINADQWSLSRAAQGPPFAIYTPPTAADNGGVVQLQLRRGIDLRGTNNPRLVFWYRVDGQINAGQRISVVAAPFEGVPQHQLVQARGGNTLYQRVEVPLVDLAGETDIGLTIRFAKLNRAAPGVYIDSLRIEETPRVEVPERIPATVTFPEGPVDLMTTGWAMTQHPGDPTVLSTTSTLLPHYSQARARFGPYNLNGEAPLLRIWARYNLRRNEQELSVIPLAALGVPNPTPLLRPRQTDVRNGDLELFEVDLSRYANDPYFFFDLVLESENGSYAGIDVSRVELLDAAALDPIPAGTVIDFDGEHGDWLSSGGDNRVVAGAGRDGTAGLVLARAMGPYDWRPFGGMTFGRTFDLTDANRPVISMWLNLALSTPDQWAFVEVESENEFERRLLIRDERGTHSEGFMPVRFDMAKFAGESDVKVRITVEGPAFSDFQLVVDDLSLGDDPPIPPAMLSILGEMPHDVYFNGESLGSNWTWRAGSRYQVQPVLGKNVIAVEMDTNHANNRLAVGLDWGRRRVVSDGPLRTAITAKDGWQDIDYYENEILIGDFEDGYGDWVVQGASFGEAPTAGTLARQPGVSNYQGIRVANSYNGGHQSTGSLFSPVFRLERQYLHFLIAGGDYAHGNPAGCTCIRIWEVDPNGLRERVLADFHVSNSAWLRAERWDVPEEHLNHQVQIEIADEIDNSGWGFVLGDDFYLSDDPEHHGAWRDPSNSDPVGYSYDNYYVWPFFDLHMGARHVRAGHAESRYFRYEFEVGDADEDGIPDAVDLCPNDPEEEWVDTNHNGVGDRCDPCPDCENVALHGVVTTSGSHSNDYHHRAINDGVTHEDRSLARQGTNARHFDRYARGYSLLRSRQAGWYEVDLGFPHEVCTLRWKNSNHMGHGSYSTRAWRISLKLGDVENVVDEGDAGGVPPATFHTTVLPECPLADRVRFYIDSYNRDGGALNELEIYGVFVE